MLSEYSKAEINFLTELGYKSQIMCSFSRKTVFEMAFIEAFIANKKDRNTETLRLIAEAFVAYAITWVYIESIINRS